MADERPPYEAYATIMGTFAAGLAIAGALGRRLDRGPSCNTWLDFALLSAATFKAARTVARDKVTAPLRAPFVEGEADGEHEEPVQEGGMTQAIGELVTCTRCVGTWCAAGLATTQVLSPRFGRLLTLALGTAGVNDFLQAGFTALSHKTNELGGRTSGAEG
jgi:hypothetical protein